MSIKNSYVVGKLRDKHIIQYIRDVNGYVKGVAVSFGIDKIGWSMVSPEDHTFKREKAHNVPAIAYKLRKGETWNDIVPTPLFQNLVNCGFCVRSPKFNKDVGLEKAIHRALASRTKIIESPKQEIGKPQEFVATGDLIRDLDLEVALENLAVRARKYFLAK